MLESIPYIGEIFALTTAFIWAGAVILFKKSGETVHPLALNLFKNSMAFVMYPITLAAVGKSILYQSSSYDFWMLML
ncbi:hypothetical protein K8I28_16540, partial [bacterium]|nr:hypothetical protein [bacterium]